MNLESLVLKFHAMARTAKYTRHMVIRPVRIRIIAGYFLPITAILILEGNTQGGRKWSLITTILSLKLVSIYIRFSPFVQAYDH